MQDKDASHRKADNDAPSSDVPHKMTKKDQLDKLPKKFTMK